MTGSYLLGGLTTVPAAERPDLLAPSTRAAVDALGLGGVAGVVEIDPDISDTAATQEAFGLEPTMLANCVVVGGKRQGQERLAACMVLASTRADVNGAVRRRLDVRKASFVPMDRAVAETGMEHGGITPIGLPAAWPLLVDAAVTATELVVIGSGVRRSKILLPGSALAGLPGAEVIDGLGL